MSGRASAGLASSAAVGASASPALEVRKAGLAGLRVLVAHDWIVSWAGSERCVEEMLRLFPDADLRVGLVSPAIRERNDTTRRAVETWLARLPGARNHHRWFLPFEGLAFATLDTSGYDLVISSSHSFAKMVRARPGAAHLCYCYSPPRYLYDLSETYRRDARGIQRLALTAATGPLRWVDRRSARGVGRFVGISRFIAQRIQRAYGLQADVVYPPVAGRRGHKRDLPRGNFLLHLGRLVAYKRVDLAIRAAERVGIHLVIAGDGPERARLEQMAGSGTTFLGEVSEAEAARLLSTCAAFVFCAEEDFGIAPVEANAHGTPVVGLARGALTETMVAGETAELFETPDVDDLAGAIERALDRGWDRTAIRRNAARFSAASFREGLVHSIKALVQHPRVR